MDENQESIISRMEEDPEVLRERFQQWGYLYIKNYLEKKKCQQLLADILAELVPHIAHGDNNGLPVLHGKPFFETDATWNEVYPRIQSLEAFHSFFHEPEIIDLMQTVSNDEVFVYPIKMARISTPGKIGYETPPHQDAYSHHAGPTMAGIWVALHDVSAALGRVKILPGSHQQGMRHVLEADGVGGVQCEIYPDETLWHVSDFECGDVLIFHSCTVHKAEPNTTENTVRISVDTRFCDYGAPVFYTNLEPHHSWSIENLCWDNIYAGWNAEQYQYYWKDYPNLF